MDEERSNGILRVLFKVIIVIIFILFIIWLLSVSIRNSTNTVVTDNKIIDSIYQQNLDRMKDAGISYYTLERLPKNTNDIKKITLGEMYEQHLLLEIQDEDGNACSTDDSYIEVIKLENEYKMKVKLECPKKDAYIVVYLGCYDYCKGFVCEKQGEAQEVVIVDDNAPKGTVSGKTSGSSKPKTSTKPSGSSQNNTVTEYEYVKRTNGHWTDWSAWSKWQREPVTESDTVKVQTKTVTEEYTYEEEVEQIVYADVITNCPSGYEPNPNGKNCRKITSETTNPVCPTVEGYTLIGRDGFTCTYKSNRDIIDPVCPTVSGYTLIGRDGFTCTYKSNTTANPVCPMVSGYTLISRNGFTCTYKSNTTVDKVCPSTPSGYTYVGIESGKCVYKKFLKREQGKEIPQNTSTRIYEYVSGPIALQDCDTCGYYYGYIYNVFARKALSKVCPSGYELIDGACHKTTTRTATCPSGYVNINNSCVKQITRTASCPEGTENLNGICVKKMTKTATCPSGYEKINNSCVKMITKTATCPKGYEKINNTCKKVLYKDYEKSCPAGYNFTNDGSQCYKKDIITVLKHGIREVTYYRFATREYIGGSVVYKWSTSNHDESLLSQGYVLTGRTRQRG